MIMETILCHRDPDQRIKILPGRKYPDRHGEGLEQREIPGGSDPGYLKKKLLLYIGENKIRTGIIFCTRSGQAKNRSNIWREMKKIAELAGISLKKVFPHNLRHLFARTFYRKTKKPDQSGGYPGSQQPGHNQNLCNRRDQRVEEKYRTNRNSRDNIILIMLFFFCKTGRGERHLQPKISLHIRRNLQEIP